MTTKEYLNQIGHLDNIIQNKLTELYQLRQMANSVTITPKEVDVQTTSNPDKLGGTIAKIVDLEREIDNTINAYIDKRKKIISQIDNIKDTDMYCVLAGKYIIRKNLTTIASEMNYSFRQIKRIHGKALSEFEKLYGEEYL